MSEEPFRDYADELEGQMRAAGALIESLEEEVASLRRDLDQASAALKAAQDEVSVRERVLQEKEEARVVAEKQAEDLRHAVTELRIQNSDEQLNLTNRHIAELASLQDRFYSERRSEIEATLSRGGAEALKTEYRKLQEAAKRHHEQRASALESAYQEAREKLRAGEQDLARRRASELERIERVAEEQSRSFQEKLQEQVEAQLEEIRRTSASHYDAEVEALRAAFAKREHEFQSKYEAHEREVDEKLRREQEQHQTKLREIKSLAETREQELRQAHATRLAEAKAEADRRLAALQAQREADNKALRDRREKDVADLARAVERAEREKRELEEELAKRETADANATPEEPGRPLGRVTELEEALADSERAREALVRELEELRTGGVSAEAPASGSVERPERRAGDETDPADERARTLELQLQEAREENRRVGRELEQALERLRRLSEPEQRLRTGIEAFNASEHARHVASISKALGQPRVYAGVEGDPPGKPVFMFVWEDFAWRRYLAEPVEGVTGPRVYLVAGKDDTEGLDELDRESNARVDARGHVTLGVQAR